jgi:predicted ATPase/DNA-binding CsgD family transcriptional regulator
MKRPSDNPWIEPLKPREAEILRLIRDGLSNRELSQRLFLSQNTVKWYNKQIFAKLGVANRTQAVRRATTFGFLQEGSASHLPDVSLSQSNLPEQITSFIGRDREVNEIKGLLKTSRLVVISGPGGVGKTRLAVQVAGELRQAYKDGVWLVEFASLREPGLAADAICQVLMVTGVEAEPVDTLKRFLARKHLLLVLDNLEHLPEATPLVGELLAAAPQVTILATSRERLHVYGEMEYRLQPLGLPDLHHLEPGDNILAVEAVHLFVDRASLAGMGFVMDEAQISAIARICVHLDGLPLAIELAASHVNTLPPDLLAQRLERDLDALPAGPRNLPERQQTLRSAIQWSYHLLNEQEKALFARLSVFRGGGALPDIEAICSAELSGNFLHHFISLVEKNLVYSRQGHIGEPRFAMLETIREFAAECLSSSGEATLILCRHADHFTQMAENAAQELRGARQAYWFTHLNTELDNLRAVLTWSLEQADGLHGLRLVSALGDYWYYNGKFSECHYWSQFALKKSHNSPPALRAGVLTSAGNSAWGAKNYQVSKDYFDQALQLYRQAGDERQAAWTQVLIAASGMGMPAELQASLVLCNQGLETLAALHDKPGMARALTVMGELERLRGEDDPAKGHYEEALAIAKETGERLRQAFLSTNLSLIACHRQEYTRAILLIQHAISILQEMKVEYPLATNLGCLAVPVAESGSPEHAATLLGAADKVLGALGADYQAGDQPDIQRVNEEIRQQMGKDEFQAAWQAGQAMTLAEAISFALDVIGNPGETDGS